VTYRTTWDGLRAGSHVGTARWRPLDPPTDGFPFAFVAGHGAPLISERAATRGRIATAGGDELAGAKRRYPWARQLREHARRTAQPGTRTLVDDAGTRPIVGNDARSSANAAQRAGAA